MLARAFGLKLGRYSELDLGDAMRVVGGDMWSVGVAGDGREVVEVDVDVVGLAMNILNHASETMYKM